MITQALLNCALTAVLGEAATAVLKIIGIAQNADSFIAAVKSGDPERIIVESIRLAVSVYALKSQCFTGDTLVSTADGDRRIDEIEAGDYVWSYDTECDEKVLAKVTNVSVTETDVLVHVITSEGDDIRTTMFHPFYVKSIVEENGSRYNGEWKAASNLIVGDELLTDDGRVVYVEEVRIERLAENIVVYNLEIGVWHTYFVDDGVLAHNMCKVYNDEYDDYLDDETPRRERVGKQNGKTPRSNTKQNEQFNQIAKKLNLTKNEKELLHDLISHQGYGYQELLDFAEKYFNK